MLDGEAKNWVIRAGVAVLGVTIILGGSACRGETGGSTPIPIESRIPSKLWEGGGATLVINLETSEPTRVHASFASGENRSLEADETIQPGRHSWTIDLPADCYVFFSPSAIEPKVGAKMSWTVTLDGHPLLDESQTLEQPLQPNYAFGFSLEIEDLAEMLSELEAEKPE